MRRHVLIEESSDGRIELIADGEIDESHLEAIEGFIRRRRAILAMATLPETDEVMTDPFQHQVS